MTAAEKNGEATRRRKADVEAAVEKPPRVEVDVEGIPTRLRELPQWIVWKWEQRRDKKSGKASWTKPPYFPGNANPERMPKADAAKGKGCEFEVALARFRGGYADGIGFVFSPDLPFCGIDLDDCRDPATGEIEPWALDALRRLNSYAEVSPSQTGVKIIIEGRKPPGGNRKGQVEFYDRGRYFTVTGRRVEEVSGAVEARQAELEQFHAEVFKSQEERPTTFKARAVGPLDEQAILDKARAAKNGADFARLWDGDTSAHNGDDSAADLALACHLAFWFGPNRERIDQMFRQSALYRPKWDERHYSDGRTYGQATIDKALKGRTEFFGHRNNRRRSRAAPSENGDGGAAPEAGETEEPTVCQVIVGILRERFDPKFRRGTSIYSLVRRQEYRKADVIGGCPEQYLDRLVGAVDAPRDDKGEPDPTRFPAAWKKWAPFAYETLLDQLEDEDEAAEVATSAAEEFRARVAAAFHSLHTMAEVHEKGKEAITERRQVIEWASLYGEGFSWNQVRSLLLWSKRDKARWRVAFRAELFGQLPGHQYLAGLGHRKFSGLAVRYEVALAKEDPRARDTTGKQWRLLELAPEFLEALYFRAGEAPVTE